MATPYIMPDGGKLADVLRSERKRAQKRTSKSSELTGKQAQADLVGLLTLRARDAKEGGSASSDQELAELRALESVGVRRRRRWLNEKHLRDLAGPLSASDMAALFNPVPFGGYRESPLQQIREDPETAAVWESFRNIDPEKESRVLQKWAEYNTQLTASRQGDASHSARCLGPAAAALRSWSQVSKASRHALRKANVHSVLALETQVLELVEQGDTSGRLTLQLEDAFGRMLVHGLAQFHGLMSSSSKHQAGAVSVHFRPEQQAQSDAAPVTQEITCTDVLLAMAELGSSGLTHDGLCSFVRKQIHGLSSEASSEADWVLIPS